MAKARCRTCEYFEWYFITGEKDHDFMKSRCGLHGGAVVDPDGEVEYVDDDHFYSNYMLEASGKKFQYVGNIHHDISVLIDRKGKEVINER